MIRKKLALLSMAGVLALSLTIGGATYAMFRSTATNVNNTFTAGTLKITSARDDIPMTGPMFYSDNTNHPGTMKTGLWAPGDKNTRGLFLKNSGTLDAKLKTLSANTADADGNAVTSGAAYDTDVAFANASDLKIWQLNFFSPFGPSIQWPKLTANQLDDLMETVNAGYAAWEANHPGADPTTDPNFFDQFIIYMNQYMMNHINEIKQNNPINSVFNDGIVKVTKLYSQDMNNIVNHSVDVSGAGISIKPNDSILLAYTVELKSTAGNSLQGITPYFSFGSDWSSILTPVQLTVQSIAPLNIEVSIGTALNAVGLPTQVQLTLSDNTTMSVPVTWDSGTPAYDANRVGTYSFAGTPDLSGSPNVAATNLKATANVVVEFASGLGTVSDPYIAKTPFQLNNVRKYLSAYFKLNSDIDLNVAPYNQGEGWLPIGQTKFQGSFDGNGYIIRNLLINRPTKSGGGLFAVVGETGKVDNVKLENVAVSATHNTGGLVAIIYPGGIVSNSSVTGSVVSTDLSKGGQLGGLVGFNYGGTVNNSEASVTVSGTHRIGGLVGNNWGVIKHSRVTASNITGAFLVGGLAGMNYTDGTVTNVVNAVIETSSADAIVTGIATDSLAGGLVGDNAGGALKNNYATGSVTGNKYVGGLTGRSGDFLTFPGAIENSYAANSVTGTSSVGGLVGEKLSGQVVNSYYDSVTTGKTDTGRGTPKTTTEMQQMSTFSGWDFTNIWMIQANQYPHLK